MPDEQLFQQVKLLLQRNLTPDEHKFLILASQALHEKKSPQLKTADPKAKAAKIAV
jgi:hypothetical protein